MTDTLPDLIPIHTRAAQVHALAPGAWRLEIPAGAAGRYRLAQVDDYHRLRRRDFPWRPPLRLSLRARASAPDLPGTWGFGLWNDPFSLSMGLGGAAQRFPALPNAAWFFFASPPNYLSFRDDLPAQGFLAATFQAPAIPAPLLGAGCPWPGAGRPARWGQAGAACSCAGWCGSPLPWCLAMSPPGTPTPWTGSRMGSPLCWMGIPSLLHPSPRVARWPGALDR